MATKKKAVEAATANDRINKGHYIEVMDRVDGIMEQIESRLIQHPLLQKSRNIRLKKKASKAINKLMDIYTAVGAEC